LDITIPIIESLEDEADTIASHYFRAEIIKDSLGGEVRITAASEDAIIILRPVSTPVEILWHQLKEVFVNQIFINSKQNKGIRIRSFILESYYNWVNKARGVLTKTSLSEKVRWFLNELLVAPNASIRKMGQLAESNKQKLLKQYLLTNMDTMVLNLKTVATKLKNIKSVRPEMEQLLKISESGIAQVENYSFLRHLLADLFDEEDEIINQHVALLDRIHAEVHTTYQEILIDGVQRHLEKSGEEDSSYYDILITDLQKNLKNIDKGENLLGKTKENDLAVAEFISDSNGGKLELEAKNIKILKKDKESRNEKIEDFEYFILSEIEKAVKYSEQNILRKYEDQRDASKNAVTEDKKDKNAIKPDDIILHSQNQSEGEDRKNKIQGFLQDELDFMRAVKAAKAAKAKLEKTIVKDKQEDKSSVSDIKKFHVSNMPVTMDISNVRTATPNKRQTLSQRSNNDISDTQHNREINLRAKSSDQKDSVQSKIIPTDLLENFQKPVWVANEERDFAVFRKNSQISDTQHSTRKPSDIKYEKKHVSKDTDQEAKSKSHTIKHIDDEL